MKTLVILLLGISGACAIVGFISAFAANILLQFYIDHRRVKEETGQPGWKIFGSIIAPVEFYKEEARSIWKIRDVGFKAFAICAGCIALLMAAAAIWDIHIE